MNVLEDEPLRAIQSCSTLKKIWNRHYERYSGISVANQITVLTALRNTKCYRNTDIDDHIAEMETLINRLFRMNIRVKEMLQVAILLVSVSSS